MSIGPLGIPELIIIASMTILVVGPTLATLFVIWWFLIRKRY
ncbi:MAG: hypothetical protein AAF078_03745 [Planctomycetota bacterium]